MRRRGHRINGKAQATFQTTDFPMARAMLERPRPHAWWRDCAGVQYSWGAKRVINSGVRMSAMRVQMYAPRRLLCALACCCALAACGKSSDDGDLPAASSSGAGPLITPLAPSDPPLLAPPAPSSVRASPSSLNDKAGSSLRFARTALAAPHAAPIRSS